MTSRVETIAEILWHRYSPEHEDAWVPLKAGDMATAIRALGRKA